MRPALFLLPFLIAACSGSTVSVPAGPGDSGARSSSNATTSQSAHGGGAVTQVDAGSSNSESASAVDAGGPVVTVRVDAVQTAIDEVGSSQETPVDQRVGILGLTLLKGASDPSPLVVFRHTQPVDTPYNAGSSTVVGTAAARTLVAGTYTLARVPVDYVKFTVAGTYHFGVTPVVGDFTDEIALSSGVEIGGAARERGWWSASFAVGGTTEGQTTGMDADIAQPGAASHIGLDLSGDVAAYVFPVTVTIPETIDTDIEVVFTVNTYEDFHWMDQDEAGYEPGVFDVSPGSFEPVTQLGANSCTVTIGPASG